MTTTAAVHPHGSIRRGREAARGASIGFFVDCFDIYLPVIALAPANAYFFPDSMGAGTRALLDATIFVATLLGRPIGALIFGQMADHRGRKFTTVFSVIGFGVGTLVMACLPGYSSWGVGAAITLIALRFVSGIFMGGEYTAAIPLAMESAPKSRRGLYGGLITFAFPTAYIAISVLTVILLQIFPTGGADSPFARYGWRVAFVVGAAMAFGFAWYYHRKVEESHVWSEVAEGTARRRPLAKLFGREHRAVFVQALVVMLGVWFATNVATAMLPALLHTYEDLSASQITWVLIVAEVGVAIALPLLGALSQRVGRRPFLIGSGVATVVVPSIGFAALAAGVSSLLAVALLSMVVAVGGLCCYGATASYLTERFPADIRASGYGLGYSFALIIPAFYPYMLQGLGTFLPVTYAPILFLVLGGLLMTLGAARGPETRDVDM